MTHGAPARSVPSEMSAPRRGFYQRVLRALVRERVPCLVGGTYALEDHTGIRRATKDLDLFILDGGWDAAAAALAREGIHTTLPFPHWLGKAHRGRLCVDLLYASGNGLCRVDESWFTHAPERVFWGVRAMVCPVEELIWSKSFVQERERFDGADVLHLLRAQADELDWDHLLARFGENWEVLLSHLVLFRFVYPGDRDRIPARVLRTLVDRLLHEPLRPGVEHLCRGTLLSREQYLADIERPDVLDARVPPYGTLSPADIVRWTEEIPAARRATLRRRTPQRRRSASPLPV
ncbi:MAG TPA: hypothetical protein VF198_03405 [Vicinamibacterales bacterium]